MLLRRSQNDFLVLKNLTPGQFLEAPTHAEDVLNFLLQLKNQRTGRETASGFSIILTLKGIML